MVRKALLATVLTTFLTGAVFAQSPLSVGGGILFDMAELGYGRTRVSQGTVSPAPFLSVEQIGFGAWGFLDARFAELSVGFMGGPTEWYLENDEEATESGSFAALDFSLLGRFPFSLGGANVSVFPLLGVGYNLVLLSRMFGDGYPDSPSHLSSFRIQFGAGGDFGISERAFVRASVLGAWRFAGRYFNDWAREQRERPEVDRAHTTGDLGLTVKIGVGLRL